MSLRDGDGDRISAKCPYCEQCVGKCMQMPRRKVTSMLALPLSDRVSCYVTPTLRGSRLGEEGMEEG